MSHDLLLRRPPPAAALAWAGEALGGRVVRTSALTGGSSSAVHRLWLDDGSSVVLRRYVRDDVLAEEPQIVEREVWALGVAARVEGVATPGLLAADVTGESSGGAPALLLSRVPGRHEKVPTDLARIAAVLPAIHDVAVDPGVAFRFFGYGDEQPPPTWPADPSLWDRALAVMLGEWPPDEPVVFLHRDYNQGNVLWRRGHVSGVVDWQAACVGPQSCDIGWMRWVLLADVGLAAAEEVTASWEAVTGRRYHPWADVVHGVDVMAYSLGPPEQRDVVERWVGEALAALG